jgi:hypothetical protein
MTDITTSTPAPLLDQLETRFVFLRDRDVTIRKYQREMDRQAQAMRRAYELRKIARLAQRKHEEWLREEAAVWVRQKNGIKTIPGFNSRRESAIRFRMSISEKQKAATIAARAILNGKTPPEQP